MDQQPTSTTSSSIRVLTRTPSSSSSSSAQPKPPSSTPPPPPPLPEGVVIVGFLGSSPWPDVTHLINRILDANVFGSGNLDRDFPRDGEVPKVEVEEWFRNRRISYFHAEEKGIVFVQFSVDVEIVGRLAMDEGYGSGKDELRQEEQEAGDLRGFLFMFLVCHVIIFLHEGLYFDTNILKKFRMLQGAKNALTPFIRTEVASVMTSKVSTSLSQDSQPVAPAASSRPPVRASSGRHGSTVSFMSGSGSQPYILPGQYTPVILFVFLGELSDGSNSLSNVKDAAASSLNQSSSLSGSRHNAPVKCPSTVVMLARPMTKNEGGFRKKLHSALDTQIRFLIKKCRILVGTEFGGSRGVGNTTLPLFTLDNSRTVALLDRSANCRGKPLDIVTNLLASALNSKMLLDASLLENHCPDMQFDDAQAIKDFIYRQSDSLRGKGALPTNASSGSGSGVGIVAAAAAAAAASASAPAAGKTSSAPKLPTMESWISTSNLILMTLLSVRKQPVDEIGRTSRMDFRGSSTGLKAQKKILTSNNHAEATISCLKSNRGMNLKFSTTWCQRALPVAKDVYLKDLPACYPTSLHKTQLKKAVHAFQLMVKGPAVPSFVQKLEDECISIWEAGRQLCDSVSLTGKPCMHQRHSVDILDSSSTELHSSGYVYLHACACGRSRRFRDDPFDFVAANISFNHFPNCENFLPSLALPKGNLAGPLGASWSLVRLGGSRYYDASKGLLQSGFCYSEKYLSKWTIKLEQQKERDEGVSSIYFPKSFNTVSHVSLTGKETRKGASGPANHEVSTTNTALSKKVTDTASAEGSNNDLSRGFPPPMKKAFSEVVAGNNSLNLSFPPLQQKKQFKDGLERSIKQVGTNSQNNNQVHVSNNHQKLYKAKNNSIQDKKDEYISALDCSTGLAGKCEGDGDPFLQIGDNVVPIDIHSNRKISQKHSLKEVSVYVGFEHECPHGHRFLLSEGHLEDLVLMHPGRGQYESNSVAPNVGLSDNEHVASLLDRNLPIYMNCPYCKTSLEKRENIKFASTVSQLQRIYLVTPPFPVVLATCPVIQFEKSSLPATILDSEHQSQFSPGCRVILPPESFLAFRLPFVYGIQVDDKLQPVHFIEQHPELTAWLVKGTTLQLVSKEFNPDGFQMQ